MVQDVLGLVLSQWWVDQVLQQLPAVPRRLRDVASSLMSRAESQKDWLLSPGESQDWCQLASGWVSPCTDRLEGRLLNVTSSSSVFMVEGVPPNGCCQVCVPMGSPSFLLHLQEALSDQQVGLTQVPYELLHMHWVSECVRFPIQSLMTEPLFPIGPWLSCTKVPTGFQNQMSFLFNITRLVSPV